MSNNAHRDVQPPLLGVLDEILGDTKWQLPPLQPSIDDLQAQFAGKPPKMAEILKTFTLTTAWVEAKLIKTGSNSRTTSSKGVRRMKKSIIEKGYMPNHMVVIYPADLDTKGQYPGCKAISRLTEEDKKKGIQFLCADGMHRVRCVTELEQERAGQAIKFNNKVNAIILRPDIPPEYLLSLSIIANSTTEAVHKQSLMDWVGTIGVLVNESGLSTAGAIANHFGLTVGSIMRFFSVWKNLHPSAIKSMQDWGEVDYKTYFEENNVTFDDAILARLDEVDVLAKTAFYPGVWALDNQTATFQVQCMDRIHTTFMCKRPVKPLNRTEVQAVINNVSLSNMAVQKLDEILDDCKTTCAAGTISTIDAAAIVKGAKQLITEAKSGKLDGSLSNTGEYPSAAIQRLAGKLDVIKVLAHQRAKQEAERKKAADEAAERAKAAEEKAKLAHEALQKAKNQQQQSEQMQQAAEQASMESQAAKDAAQSAMDKLNTVPAPGHDSFFGTTLLDTVTADREAKAAAQKHQALVRLQRSERAVVETHLRQYTAYISSYNMSWQSWLGTLEVATTPEMVNLVLVDPPYDASFINSNQQKHLAKLFDKSVLPGGTALIWCRWKCINRWANVFQQHTLGTSWVVENVLAVTRHPKHSFRSPVNGHKQMTEFVLIAHRKDEKSTLKSLKQGKKLPMTAELEALFGDASAGSWTYDFMTNQIPPLKNWRLRWRQDNKQGKTGEACRPCAEKGPSALASLICKYSHPGEVVLDFTAGTMSTAATCLALNRNCISIESDPLVYHEALYRLKGFIEWMEAEGMEIGCVDTKVALGHICDLQPKAHGADEQISPLGRSNYPSYKLGTSSGQSSAPPSLEEDATVYDLKIVDSTLPETVDGKSGQEARAGKDFKKDEIVCYYWGDFLIKDSTRYRRLRKAQCDRFMQMTNLPIMEKYVILGHQNCAATYIQSSEYEGGPQDAIEANVIFVEQPHELMNPLRPHQYVQVKTIRDITQGETLFAEYLPGKPIATPKKRSKRKTRTGSKSARKDKRGRSTRKKRKTYESSDDEQAESESSRSSSDGSVVQEELKLEGEMVDMEDELDAAADHNSSMHLSDDEDAEASAEERRRQLQVEKAKSGRGRRTRASSKKPASTSKSNTTGQKKSKKSKASRGSSKKAAAAPVPAPPGKVAKKPRIPRVKKTTQSTASAKPTSKSKPIGGFFAAAPPPSRSAKDSDDEMAQVGRGA